MKHPVKEFLFTGCILLELAADESYETSDNCNDRYVGMNDLLRYDLDSVVIMCVNQPCLKDWKIGENKRPQATSRVLYCGSSKSVWDILWSSREKFSDTATA
jgi:hypothetical protein